MDFQTVNPLNVRLNLVSGNLLPMTADGSSFPIFWKIYSVLVWLLEILQTCVLIPGCIFVPKEKALKDGLIGLVVTMEVVSVIIRVHTCKGLAQQLIQKLNDILRVGDEMMKSIVTTTIKSMEIPLKFYWSAGLMSIILWSGTPLILIFERNSFSYVDYRMPVVYSKEPFTTSVFLFGSVIVLMSSAYIFTKKVSVDSYMINIMLLITAQYKYTALKLSMIFQDKLLYNDHSEPNTKQCPNKDYYVEKEIKALCRHHNTIIHIMVMLRKLLSSNISLIYIISVFRFCCIAIMIPSITLWEVFLVIMYAIGGVVQLYILCYCVQQLLDASVEITDCAFHEEWYQYGSSIKRLFMFMIMANNLEIKLSTFEKYNLSLSSFMAILNQSYSIALLLLKTN
ncbi:PREDICTED: odorant receptor 67a-like isoform X2 [Vollenhovia emeryi]|uniref:odorant receptor 67a-like isoform X2 n=1 Tax=Vollenhovia emeryi TaxID=411798 RepID=UPI0005F39388|nr:PREDICTED: odorant receptor 67a-like isoform X2 [Vollenhovia emeryi]